MKLVPGTKPSDQRWNSYLRKIHVKRLITIKGIVDQSPPHFLNQMFKRKQGQMNEGIFIVI